ncbi:hypothetical protein FSY75_09015 [Streptomyces sp. TR1341]|nr:hypothetical protein [Streptomyces sp. TR1341]
MHLGPPQATHLTARDRPGQRIALAWNHHGPVDAGWDLGLAPAMAALRVVLHEEATLDPLVEDLLGPVVETYGPTSPGSNPTTPTP